ncbi:MAG: ComEA family DNA-binding protein [bacterium]
MNEREKVVIFFLTGALIIGIGLNFFKAIKRSRNIISDIKVVTKEQFLKRGLDINRATVEQLEALPGIGPVIATRIIEYREKHGRFKRVDDLLNVSGIGPKRLAAIKDFVVCESP